MGSSQDRDLALPAVAGLLHVTKPRLWRLVLWAATVGLGLRALGRVDGRSRGLDVGGGAAGGGWVGGHGI